MAAEASDFSKKWEDALAQDAKVDTSLRLTLIM
jgi:hypothetical protein